MDIQKTIDLARGDVKACAESLLRVAAACDTPEELDQLNSVVQGARQVLQSTAYLIGKALQEKGDG